jgi:hypothetical protein
VITVKMYFCFLLHTDFFSSVLSPRLTAYVDRCNANSQCGFQNNRSLTDHMV